MVYLVDRTPNILSARSNIQEILTHARTELIHSISFLREALIRYDNGEVPLVENFSYDNPLKTTKSFEDSHDVHLAMHCLCSKWSGEVV